MVADPHEDQFAALFGDRRSSCHLPGTVLLSNHVSQVATRPQAGKFWQLLQAALDGEHAVIDFEQVPCDINRVAHALVAHLLDARMRDVAPCRLLNLPAGVVAAAYGRLETDRTLRLLRIALEG